MGGKSFGVVGVLFILGAVPRSLNTNSSGTAQTALPKPAQPTAGISGPERAGAPVGCRQPLDGPWNAACSYFELQNADGWKKKSLSDSKISGWSCVPRQAKLEFLIATIPDPQTTHLSLYFDRTLESLAWAIGDSNFVFQNSWLPWTAAPDRNLLLLADRDCQKHRLEGVRDQPGLLVFRHAAEGQDKDTALLVFLVGETPTSGINKAEFANAIRYIRGIRKSESSIRVVGPNFSGSMRPLAADLLNLPVEYKGLKFLFVSGFATNGTAALDFQKTLGDRAQFESVIENDERASRLFIKYLDWQCRTSPRIALLSEDETVYGNVVALLKGDPSHHKLAIRYPREVARLRNAYQEEGPLPASDGRSETSPAEGVQRTLKDVGETEGAGERDTTPTFSARQSPASQQAVLSGISTTLRRDHFDFAGIIATDILDELFLSRFLRVNSPDVRLFALNADLLFPWEEEANAPLLGVLSVTTYPLIGRNQHWTNAKLPSGVPRRIEFSSMAAEGTYNACRRLVDPADEESLMEYWRPYPPAQKHPPLWLTAVGRDGYWPIALLDDSVRDSNDPSILPSSLLASCSSPAIESRLHPEYPSKAWYLCFWLVIIFAWLDCVYIWSLLTGKKRQASVAGRILGFVRDRVRLLSSLFTAYPEGEPDYRERPFLAVGTLSVACVVFVLAVPLTQFLSGQMQWAWCYCVIAGLTFLALLALAGWLSVGVTGYYPLVAPSWLLALVLCGVWHFLNANPSFSSGIFFAYRCLHVGNGISPLAPILLLAIAYYGWSWVHLRREVSIVDRERKLPSNLSLDSRIATVDGVLEKIFSARILVPAILFILLWLLLFEPWLSLRSLEYWLYDSLYGFLLGVLYWAMAASWMQFLLCWNEFKRYLQWLERQPVRNAFSRLRKEISWVPLVTKPGNHPLLISTRTQDCLKAILEFDETSLTAERRGDLLGLKQELSPSGRRIRVCMRQLNGQLSSDGPIKAGTYKNLQEHLESAAQSIRRRLSAREWRRGDSDSLRAETELRAPKKRVTAEERLTILEEEFIALRHLMYLRYVFRQLRNLLGFIVAGFIISVISVNSYPFQGHRALGLGSVVGFIALSAGIGIVFAEMDRDAIMSRITDTNANELDKTFFFRVVQYGSLPLLTVLASQFPTINNFLFSWVKPALQALR